MVTPHPVKRRKSYSDDDDDDVDDFIRKAMTFEADAS